MCVGARVLYKQLLVDVITIVGASLSEPHTSGTAFIAKTCVCMFVGLLVDHIHTVKF